MVWRRFKSMLLFATVVTSCFSNLLWFLMKQELGKDQLRTQPEIAQRTKEFWSLDPGVELETPRTSSNFEQHQVYSSTFDQVYRSNSETQLVHLSNTPDEQSNSADEPVLPSDSQHEQVHHSKAFPNVVSNVQLTSHGSKRKRNIQNEATGSNGIVSNRQNIVHKNITMSNHDKQQSTLRSAPQNDISNDTKRNNKMRKVKSAQYKGEQDISLQIVVDNFEQHRKLQLNKIKVLLKVDRVTAGLLQTIAYMSPSLISRGGSLHILYLGDREEDLSKLKFVAQSTLSTLQTINLTQFGTDQLKTWMTSHFAASFETQILQSLQKFLTFQTQLWIMDGNVRFFGDFGVAIDTVQDCNNIMLAETNNEDEYDASLKLIPGHYLKKILHSNGNMSVAQFCQESSDAICERFPLELIPSGSLAASLTAVEWQQFVNCMRQRLYALAMPLTLRHLRTARLAQHQCSNLRNTFSLPPTTIKFNTTEFITTLDVALWSVPVVRDDSLLLADTDSVVRDVPPKGTFLMHSPSVSARSYRQLKEIPKHLRFVLPTLNQTYHGIAGKTWLKWYSQYIESVDWHSSMITKQYLAQPHPKVIYLFRTHIVSYRVLQQVRHLALSMLRYGGHLNVVYQGTFNSEFQQLREFGAGYLVATHWLTRESQFQLMNDKYKLFHYFNTTCVLDTCGPKVRHWIASQTDSKFETHKVLEKKSTYYLWIFAFTSEILFSALYGPIPARSHLWTMEYDVWFQGDVVNMIEETLNKTSSHLVVPGERDGQHGRFPSSRPDWYWWSKITFAMEPDQRFRSLSSMKRMSPWFTAQVLFLVLEKGYWSADELLYGSICVVLTDCEPYLMNGNMSYFSEELYTTVKNIDKSALSVSLLNETNVNMVRHKVNVPFQIEEHKFLKMSYMNVP